MRKLFSGGSVYSSEERRFEEADVLTDGVLISAILPRSADGSRTVDAEIIDCRGKYLIPGLVDVHTHGRAGFDFTFSEMEDVERMRRSYAESGTTTLMATLASAPVGDLLRSSDIINLEREPVPGTATIAGIHLEGRYLNPLRKGAHDETLLSSPDDELIGKLLERMLPLPAHVSYAPELDPDGLFAKAVTERGATLGIAHTDATLEEAEKALGYGAVSFTHTFNCMRPIHHREPGVAVCSLTSDAYSEFICDGEHVHPEMIRMASRIKPKDKFVLITDSMEAAGCPDGVYKIAGSPVTVTNGRAVTESGALAGSTLDLFTALKNYMRFTGLSIEEALPAATSNPAAMIKASDMCGSIEPGKRADILIIDNADDPVLSGVCAAGKIVD